MSVIILTYQATKENMGHAKKGNNLLSKWK